MPPGSEDIAAVGSQIWSASESGNRYKQLNACFEWGYYPFTFVVDGAAAEDGDWSTTTNCAAVTPLHARRR
jgi:hypothetical protein